MRIAIVGAGVGGLTLAAALRKRRADAQVDIYERDESAFSRPQGYAIGLKYDGGLGALDTLGLTAAVLAGETVRIPGFTFTDQHGRELLKLAAGDNDRRATFRVQRRHLKEVLLEAVGDTPVHFGHACVGYEVKDGIAVLRFADGRTVEADAVVGADGVGSAIRRQMIGDAKHYLGLTAIYGDAPMIPDAPLLSCGYFMSLGADGSSFFCYTQPGGSVHFSNTLHAGSEAEVADATQDDLLARVRAGTRGWHDTIDRILAGGQVASMGGRGDYDREPARTVRDG